MKIEDFAYRVSARVMEILEHEQHYKIPEDTRKRVLENEVRITGIFVKVLARLVESGHLPSLDERSIELVAHNISVLGHTWTFRRWFLARHYSIEDYIELQTDFILGLSTGKGR